MGLRHTDAISRQLARWVMRVTFSLRRKAGEVAGSTRISAFQKANFYSVTNPVFLFAKLFFTSIKKTTKIDFL